MHMKNIGEKKTFQIEGVSIMGNIAIGRSIFTSRIGSKIIIIEVNIIYLFLNRVYMYMIHQLR